jgi:hypothetical protein
MIIISVTFYRVLEKVRIIMVRISWLTKLIPCFFSTVDQRPINPTNCSWRFLMIWTTSMMKGRCITVSHFIFT